MFFIQEKRPTCTAYDSVFRYSLGHKRSYDSDADSVASENQPLMFKELSRIWLLVFQIWNEELVIKRSFKIIIADFYPWLFLQSPRC